MKYAALTRILDGMTEVTRLTKWQCWGNCMTHIRVLIASPLPNFVIFCIFYRILVIMASAKTNGVAPGAQKYGKVILTLENVLLPSEKLEPTPSKVDGLDADSEFDLRVMGCELIQTSGMLLRLPQVRLCMFMYQNRSFWCTDPLTVEG